MLEGCFKKLKGTICNIPAPLGADSAKLELLWSCAFRAVSPDAVQLALVYLKQNNPIYHDIRIDIDNISDELLDLTEEIDQEILICVESNEEGEKSFR